MARRAATATEDLAARGPIATDCSAMKIGGRMGRRRLGVPKVARKVDPVVHPAKAIAVPRRGVPAARRRRNAAHVPEAEELKNVSTSSSDG